MPSFCARRSSLKPTSTASALRGRGSDSRGYEKGFGAYSEDSADFLNKVETNYQDNRNTAAFVGRGCSFWSKKMDEFVLPVIGLGDEQSSPVTVVWADGTVLCRGILGAVFDPEAQQAYEAERARKQSLRDRGVAVLSDYQ